MISEITGINRRFGCAIVDCKTCVRITKWLDNDGDECDPDDAVVCIAGDDIVGWFSVDLTQFDKIKVN